jgi:hypothetical protein
MTYVRQLKEDASPLPVIGSASRHDPGVSWVVLKPPNTLRTSHDVQVIRLVPVRNDHRVVAAGNQYYIAILDRHGFVEIPRVRVDALKNESLRRINTMIIRFFQKAFGRKIIDFVFVGRIAGRM